MGGSINYVCMLYQRMVHNWTLLNLFLHLAACQSITMPALLPSFAQQSAKNKLQNRLNLINRTTLMVSSINSPLRKKNKDR